MASGNKAVVINTQERAISPDINRLQAFASKDLAEVLRYLMNTTANVDDDAGGIITEYAALGTPLRAEVLGGLLVRPQNASLSLLVDPGALYGIAPDAGADDSNYKHVRSAGVSVLGSLVVTANASGSTRIDVVECEITPDTIVETDSRDIFDETTGLFTAASVTKAREGSLTFRVRAGTPGAGYPGNVSGWLPLAVASVPDGTVDNSTVTFWDVRPLVTDRHFGLANFEETVPRAPASHHRLKADREVAAGELRLNGIFSAVFQGRHIGGWLRRGTPGTDSDWVDLRDAANQEPGIVFPSSGLYNVYLAFPFGLPRWAKYYDAGAREPRAPKGIPIVSTTACSQGTGRPSAALALPTSTGLGGTTSDAMCIYSAVTDAGSLPEGGMGDGSAFWVSEALNVTPPATANVNYDEYTLSAGVDYPADAKALYVTALVSFAAPVALTIYWCVFTGGGYQIFPTTGNGTRAAIQTGGSVSAAAHGLSTFRIPLTHYHPLAVPTPTVRVRVSHFNGVASDGFSRLEICGWER